MGTQNKQPVNNKSWNKRRWAYEDGINKQKLSSTKTALLHFIARKTLGFQKVNDDISFSQIQGAIGGGSTLLHKAVNECNEDRYIIYKPGCGREHLSNYTVQEDQTLWTKTRRVTQRFEDFLSEKGKLKGTPRRIPLEGTERYHAGSDERYHAGSDERYPPAGIHNTLHNTLYNRKTKDAFGSGLGLGVCAPPLTQEQEQDSIVNANPKDKDLLPSRGSGLNQGSKEQDRNEEVKEDADSISPISPIAKPPSSPVDISKRPATAPQLKKISVELERLGWSEDDLFDFAGKRRDELTLGEAREAITDLIKIQCEDAMA